MCKFFLEHIALLAFPFNLFDEDKYVIVVFFFNPFNTRLVMWNARAGQGQTDKRQLITIAYKIASICQLVPNKE